MKVSGCSMVVYCDCPFCMQNLTLRKTETFASDAKKPKRDCRRQMRKAGWLSYVDANLKLRLDYSPACLGEDKKIPKEWIEHLTTQKEND